LNRGSIIRRGCRRRFLHVEIAVEENQAMKEPIPKEIAHLLEKREVAPRRQKERRKANASLPPAGERRKTERRKTTRRKKG
jgi:hypothetical protein